VCFFLLLFPPGFEGAAVAWAAIAGGIDASAHSARRLTNAIGPDTQVDVDALGLVLYKPYSLPDSNVRVGGKREEWLPDIFVAGRLADYF
jgi:hypothetical protein